MNTLYKTLLLSFLASVAFGQVHAIVPRGEGSDQPKHPLARQLGESKEFQELIKRIRFEQEPVWDRNASSYFRSTPSFQTEAPRAREALLKTGMEQDKTFKIAHVKGAPAVFKSAVDRQSCIAGKDDGENRTLRNTHLEFASAQLAEAMGLSHVVAPVAVIKEKGYEGILEKTIFLLSDAQKKSLGNRKPKSLKDAKTPFEKLHLALNELARQDHVSPSQYLQELKGINLWRISDAFDTMDAPFDFNNVFSTQNIQDLFLFSFFTRQRDAAARNLMVDATDENNLCLVMTDTEYSLMDSVRFHKESIVQWMGRPHVPDNQFAFLTEKRCFDDTLTPETEGRIRSLDMAKIHRTLDKFYPDMHKDDRKELEDRVNFSKGFVIKKEFTQTCFELWWRYGQTKTLFR